jgi:hypothetical protein
MGEVRQQRQREQPVGDRSAEGARGRALGVDVDPLVVLGRVGEEVHAVLRDLEPLGGTEL